MARAKAKETKAVGNLGRWDTPINTEATKTLIAELAVSSKKPWYEPEIGKDKYISNFFRVVPKHPDAENPWNIVPVHYLGAGNSTRMVVCVKEANLQGECPACIIRWDLHEGGDEQGAKGLRVSIRSFLNVLKLNAEGGLALNDEGEPDETIYILSLNQMQFLGKRQVKYDLDEESELPFFFFFEKYGDISSVARGRDVLVRCKKDKSGDYDTVAMKFSVANSETPFPGTFEMLEGEGFNDLQQVVQLATAEEVMQIIEGRSPTALPAAAPVPQLPAPAAVETSRFGGDDEENETPPEATHTPVPEAEGQDAPAAEEKPDNPRAAPSAPKTNQQAAIARLRDAQEKGG